MLLILSLLFYAWGEPIWVLLIMFSALLDWLSGRVIEANRGGWKAKASLALSLTVNLGILVAFKYSGFFVENFNALTGLACPVPSFTLPVGISFYTFKTVSYVLDVYRGDAKAEKSYARYLMYLSLYHQLMAGPIVRYRDIAGEIGERRVTLGDFSYGVARFCTGLAKKAVLASAAGTLASQYLDAGTQGLPVAAAWFGILMYALQIYFDFSGYSDMAIGLGRMFGFHYFENFRYPYVSRSASEFWRRWHISLGSFFRDYVYIPLGGNRKRQYFNLAVVWFLTGLWHGASWNFILWGLYYGALIALERLFLRKWLDRLPRFVSHLYLIVLTLVGWVFFYFTDLTKGLAYLKVMFFASGNPLTSATFSITLANNVFFVALALLACLPIAPWIAARLTDRKGRYAPALLSLGQAVCSLVFLGISTAMLVGESYSPFLYFRF